MDKRNLATVEQMWRREVEAATTYRHLADREQDQKRKEILLRLVDQEEKHAARWAERLFAATGKQPDRKEVERGLSMVEGLQHQRYDGLMFIGYHSAAGERGVLAHTINGRAFYRVSLNGEAVGESDLYAAAAAELNVPLWLVSGDDELQRWIAERYPQSGYVCVKRALSQTAAESLSPQRARAEIRERAMQQVRQGARLPVERRFMPPYRLTLMAAKPVLADLFSLVPGVERQDALTVAFDSDNMAAQIRLLSVFSYLATTQS